MDKKTILLVDNDPEFLAITKEYLEQQGYLVIEAVDTLQARSIVSHNKRIDLAILDLRLTAHENDRDITGILLAKTLAPTVPKIILTAYPYNYQAVREVLRPQDGPAMGFVAKQEGLEELLATIEDTLQITNLTTSTGSEATPFAPLNNQQVDFVLVTALAEERDAVLDKLRTYRKLSPSLEDIRTYYQTELPVTYSNNLSGVYNVITMSLLGMGRVQAATATTDAIRRWHPRYIVLVGIAGGLAMRNIEIGDILISDQIVDYELQKLTAQGPQIRWDVQRANARLLNACNNFAYGNWHKAIHVKRPGRGKPKCCTGTIASGDKVIAFGDVLARYQNLWPKLIGVEMEAAGVATAVFQASENIGFFMVRCVSDLADENKGSVEAEKWRSYACNAAAAFTIELLKSGPVPLCDELKPSKESTNEK